MNVYALHPSFRELHCHCLWEMHFYLCLYCCIRTTNGDDARETKRTHARARQPHKHSVPALTIFILAHFLFTFIYIFFFAFFKIAHRNSWQIHNMKTVSFDVSRKYAAITTKKKTVKWLLSYYILWKLWWRYSKETLVHCIGDDLCSQYLKLH